MSWGAFGSGRGFTISGEGVGDDRSYRKEGLNLELFKYNGQAVSLQLPQYVELAIASTEPGTGGDTAAGGATKVDVLGPSNTAIAHGIGLNLPLTLNFAPTCSLLG